MQFKWAKYWLLSSVGYSLVSSAAVTVVPTSPYTTSATSGTTKAYFGDANSRANLADTGDGFKAYTFSTLASADTARSHMLKFDVTTSTTSFTSGVVAVQAAAVGASTYAFIPVVYFSGADCSSTTCNSHSTFLNGTYFFSAPYTNGTTGVMTVGIYVQDLCAVLNNTSNSAGATVAAGVCSAGSYSQPTSGSSAEFSLKFWVAEKNDTTTNYPVVSDSANSTTLTVNLSNGLPTLSCSNLENAYFPSDSKILLDTSTAIFSATTNSSLPLSTLIVTANETSKSLNTTASFSTENSISSRLTLGSGTQTITGFGNTTDGSDRKYAMKFAVRNHAGIMSSFGCELNPVQTSDVDGALNADNCFIATAAFGDKYSLPVKILREFRNQVLYRFDAGIEFTKWYYSWSPEAAAQFRNYPVIRSAAFRLLLPVSFGAWLIINPILLISVFLISITILVKRIA